MQAEAPQVATQPAWQPPKLRSGEKVLAYTSATTMLVDEPGTSSNVMVESSWPLVTADSAGALAPTDMTLQPLVSGGWAPANSPIQAVIGRDLGAGATLGAGANTLTVHPGGARSATGARSANKVFYANTDADIDTIVEPMPNGIGLDWTLRSPSASEQTSMTLDLPAGVTLLQSGPTVNLMQGGRMVGMVSPPLAWDAQDTQVPVRYDVSGSTITVTTSHHGRDLAYPVSVDPVISYNSGTGPLIALDPGSYPGPTQTGNWVYTALPGYEPYFGGGFVAGRFFITSSPNLSAGNAVWMNRRLNAFATRVDFPDLRFSAAANVCVFAGLWNFNAPSAYVETNYSVDNSGVWSNQMFSNCGGLGKTYITACASSVCDPNVGTTANWAGVNLTVMGPISGPNASMSFTGAYLYWNDHDAPVLSGVDLPTGWTKNNTPTVWVHLHDDGLGIGTDSVNGDQRALAWGTVDNEPAWQTVPLYENKTVCGGTLDAQCWTDGETNLSFYPIPDGIHTAHITGRDILGHTSTTDRTLAVDAHAPTITTTGRLADLGRSTSGSEPVRSVSKKVHMTAVVSDAVPNVATSGLASFGLTITQPGHATVPVTTHTVLTDGSWKLDGYDFVPNDWNQGPVTFALNATDVAGNVSTNTFTVNVARGDITTLIEGQKTAKRLVLQAEDTKLTSPASTVVFQYRTKATAWQSIPAANLQAMDGGAIGTNSFAVSSSTHRSPQVVYNVADQMTTGQVFVRGVFSSAAGDTTDDVLTGIDLSGLGTSDSMVDAGPGKVDELTGNFQLTDTDVDIDSYKEKLGITRTYNSRNLQTIFGTTQPFGPGWTLGMPVDDDASIYTKVIDYDASSDPDTAFLGAAEVDTSDGNTLPFEQHEADNGYYALPEFENLSLQRQVDAQGHATSFTLKDRDSGQTLIFDRPSGSPGEWMLSSVQQATSAVKTTFQYASDTNGPQKLTDVIAPSPVDCSGANLTTAPGCRSLHLTWNSAWTRVMSIDFVAPGHGLANNRVPVAAYTYTDNSDMRLTSAYDPRQGAALATRYAYDSNGRLATITPPGENAWTLSYTRSPTEFENVGRLGSASRSQPVGAAGTPTTATETGVPPL